MLKNDWSCWGGIFDLDTKIAFIEENEKLTTASDFWEDSDRARDILQQITERKTWVDAWRDVCNSWDDVVLMNEMAEIQEASTEEVDECYLIFSSKIEDLELKKMLSSAEDKMSAILEINSGAGGTESLDWAYMLLRMYRQWAEKNRYKIINAIE